MQFSIVPALLNSSHLLLKRVDGIDMIVGVRKHKLDHRLNRPKAVAFLVRFEMGETGNVVHLN